MYSDDRRRLFSVYSDADRFAQRQRCGIGVKVHLGFDCSDMIPHFTYAALVPVEVLHRFTHR